MKTLKVAALAAGAVLGLSACSGTGQSEGPAEGGDLDLSYAVVTHGAPGDAFWDRVKSGAERAGKDYSVSVEYSSDPDPAKQSQLIDGAVADKVDGIVVSMANPDGLESSVKDAVEAGIPVITINSGIEKWEEFGAMTHVGQSEELAGQAAGEELKAAGLKNVLCVIQEAGNVGLESRCKAAGSSLGGKLTNLQVDGTDDNAVTATITSKLQSDKSIDGVLTLGGQYGIDAVSAVEESGSSAKVATFDLSSDVITAIEDGKIEFAVDQQPYVQGYAAVTGLYLKGINGNDFGGGQPVYSGPALITKENASEVKKFADQGDSLTMATATAAPDERIASNSLVSRILKRPEVGALVAAIAVFVFFAALTDTFATASGASTWLRSASTIGIMAVAVALLMIGGEFDLSAGAMTGFTGLTVGVLTTQYGLNIWVAMLVALAFALGIGALNGIMVMRTGLPSFIVTLGTFFVLQGIDLALVKALIGQVAIQGMSQVPFYNQPDAVFGSSIDVAGGAVYASVFWWIAVTAVATWVLLRTKAGNWIFAVGGAQHSSRQVGVPVARTKIALFMTSAGAGWLVGMLLLFTTSTVQSNTGVGQEFIYIICAVVGGCLLTGGYGSAVGAALGALIYGMTNQGIVYAGWDNNWLKAFLGTMLLGAVLLNEYVRKRAESSR